MKSAAAMLIVAIIWCYPLVAEGTLGACDALASQALHIGTLPGPTTPDTVTLIKSTGDYTVPKSARQRYPLLPSSIACAGYYWRLLVDPAFIGTMKTPGTTQ